ncbi:MAG: cell wall hydrolase [Lachnospiraceae bacterium]|nr:cell wall hydrolase [Robinsoniella sp.]MDY3767646.1 cell wall hydrolase [Lachnospiraceae bacterium]
MNKKVWMVAAVLFLMLTVGVGFQSEAAWQKLPNGNWRFTDESARGYKIGWQEIDGKLYYFDPATGYRKTGWIPNGNTKRYCRPSDGSAVISAWVKVGKYYYLNRRGNLVVNSFITTNGLTHYVGADGAMVAQKWVLVKGKYYYLNARGVMPRSTWVGNRYVNRYGVWVKDAVKCTDLELRYLAAITYLEAGNQPYQAKLGVANVVLNRVKDPRYPNNIISVLYQPWQFEPAMTGSLDRLVNSNQEIQAQCMTAAKAAMTGTNNVPGCIGFDFGSNGIKYGVINFFKI